MTQRSTPGLSHHKHTQSQNSNEVSNSVMTTVEKLLVQIFERKNWIIQQVKHQTELYNQHLASQLLIDGVTPPSWLWNPNLLSDSAELNKEDLISKFLLPHSRPPVRDSSAGYSQYCKQVDKNYLEVADGFSREAHVPNAEGSDTREVPNVIVEGHESNGVANNNSIPELDVSVSSPVDHDQLDVRISNIFSAPDQSLARIQRSKSRQRAIELRNSAKSQAKSNSRILCSLNASSSGFRLTALDSEKTVHANESIELPETCAISSAKSQPKCHSKTENDTCACSIGPALDSEWVCKVDQLSSLAEPIHVSSQNCRSQGKTERDSESLGRECNGDTGPATMSESSDTNSSHKEPSPRNAETEEMQCNVFNGSTDRSLHSAEIEKDVDSNESDGESKGKGNEVPAERLTRFRSAVIGCKNSASNRGECRTEEEEEEEIHSRVEMSVTPKSSAKRVSDVSDSVLANRSCDVVLVKDMINGTFYHVPENINNHPCPVNDLMEQPCCANGSLVSIASPNASLEVFGGREAELEDKPPSISKDVSLHMASQPDVNSFSEKMTAANVVESDHKLSKKLENDGSPTVARMSVVLIHGRGSENISVDKKTSNLASTSCVAGCSVSQFKVSAGENSVNNDGVRNASGGQVILPSPDIYDEVEHLKYGDKIVATEPETYNLAEDYTSSYELDCPDATSVKELEYLDARPPVDCLVYVKPNQLDFGNINDLHETFDVSLEIESREKSFGNVCSSLPEDAYAAGLIAGDIASEIQEINRSTAIFNLEMEKLYKSEMDANSRDMKDLNCSSDTTSGVALSGTKSPDIEKNSNVKHHMKRSIEPILRIEKDVLSSAKNYENTETHPCDMSEASLLLKLTEEVANEFQGGLVDAMSSKHLNSVTSNARNHADGQKSNLESDVFPLGTEKSSCTERTAAERKLFSPEDHQQLKHLDQSPHDKGLELINDDESFPELACSEKNYLGETSFMEEDGLLSSSVQSPQIELGVTDADGLLSSSVQSPQIELGVTVADGLLSSSVQSPQIELGVADADKSLPEFEGFFIDPQSENEALGITGDIIKFNKLDSAIARASMLEQICRSASACTPLSHLPSGLKLDRMPNLFQSLPNGPLERTDYEDVHFPDEVGEFQVSFSIDKEADSALERISFIDSLPCSGTPVGLSSVNRFTSPDGKFWESLSSQSGSSGKRVSSNPELTCFPIEEDPSDSEGNGTKDEDSDKTKEDIDSISVNRAVREPLANITEACLNPPASVSGAEAFLNRVSVNSVNTEASFTGTHNKLKHNLRSSYKDKGKGKESQTPSIGANGKRMAKESQNNRYKKLKLTGKTSLRNKRQNLSVELKCSNIVSNVSSFIPLVQQKQAATACAGKREIKVKALEVAEAAKRQEEKREIERRLKKEAIKIERARMEQENARQRELNKKKKEDEQKRKDADMAARKRMREEEDRKEKEKKRKRIEEILRQPGGQDAKLHAEKEGNLNSKKESNNEWMKHPKVKAVGDDATCKTLENEPKTTALSTSDVQQPSTMKNCSSALNDNKQAQCTPDKAKTTKLAIENIREISYEISPYQCSDDEDDEEDELPTKKFIPSWTSKNLVAMSLPLQQEVDPDRIFPLETFCSMDEVLLPRKLQQKQLAL